MKIVFQDIVRIVKSSKIMENPFIHGLIVGTIFYSLYYTFIPQCYQLYTDHFLGSYGAAPNAFKATICHRVVPYCNQTDVSSTLPWIGNVELGVRC